MQKSESPGGVRTLFPDEAKAFMDEHEEGKYVLLDVRQPYEYEEAHLPGATLIPLPQLLDSADRLDPEQPVLVYCAVGGRSRMAAQLLTHAGVKEVFHLEGGIGAWEGRTATGPRELHLGLMRGDEDPREMVLLAYAMEEGLRKFHDAMRGKSTDQKLSALLESLIRAEESHERTLLELLPDREKEKVLKAASADAKPLIMEGGVRFEEFMAANALFLLTVEGYLDVAMMIETQALDLYLRMASKSTNEDTARILFRIADEEKAHLSALGSYMDEKLGAL